jgi:acyl carrier protein
MDQLKSTLRRALVSKFGIRSVLEDDTGLFSGGLIDSLSVMDLVGIVEEQIGCTIPAAEITFANFDSINSIVRFSATLSSSSSETDG